MKKKGKEREREKMEKGKGKEEREHGKGKEREREFNSHAVRYQAEKHKQIVALVAVDVVNQPLGHVTCPLWPRHSPEAKEFAPRSDARVLLLDPLLAGLDAAYKPRPISFLHLGDKGEWFKVARLF